MDRIKASEPGRVYVLVATIQEEKSATQGTSKTTEADIANFYGKLFHGQAPIATVTLNDRAVEEAMRFGLLDTAKDYIILAYRNLKGQALIKILAGRYDGLAILRPMSRRYDAEFQSIPHYLTDSGGLQDYLAELNHYCRDQIAKAQQQPMILAVAELVRSHRAVLSGALDTLAKYQVMLDNDLYKAQKALREAQHREGGIICADITNGFVLENASEPHA